MAMLDVQGLSKSFRGLRAVSDVTFAVPASGPEVDFGSWKDDGKEHLIVFTEGALRIRLVGVKFGGRGWSSDPGAGNYDKTVKFEATDLIEG